MGKRRYQYVVDERERDYEKIRDNEKENRNHTPTRMHYMCV